MKFKSIIDFLKSIDKKTVEKMKMTTICFPIQKSEIDKFINDSFEDASDNIITNIGNETKNVYVEVVPSLIISKELEFPDGDFVHKNSIESKHVNVDIKIESKLGYVDIKNLPKVRFKEFLSMSVDFDEKSIIKINKLFNKHIKEDIYCYMILDSFKYFSLK